MSEPRSIAVLPLHLVRKEERMSSVLERLAEGEPVRVVELSREFRVATATIRRDLALIWRTSTFSFARTEGRLPAPCPTSRRFATRRYGTRRRRDA